jgi:hypothetical protein
LAANTQSISPYAFTNQVIAQISFMGGIQMLFIGVMSIFSYILYNSTINRKRTGLKQMKQHENDST